MTTNKFQRAYILRHRVVPRLLLVVEMPIKTLQLGAVHYHIIMSLNCRGNHFNGQKQQFPSKILSRVQSNVTTGLDCGDKPHAGL